MESQRSGEGRAWTNQSPQLGTTGERLSSPSRRSRPAHRRNLARATLAGFAAAVVDAFHIWVVYGAAGLRAEAGLLDALGLQVVHGWLEALTNNQVIDLARPNLYAALGLPSATGVLWALAYAGVVEPRLSGPDWQRRGGFRAASPAIFSLVASLPMVGGGFFGVE
jgi:hypothetical protein